MPADPRRMVNYYSQKPPINSMKEVSFLLGVNKRSSDYFIDRDDFLYFFLKKFRLNFLLFCDLAFNFFFKFSSFSLLKGKQTSLLNSKRLKFTKNVIEF